MAQTGHAEKLYVGQFKPSSALTMLVFALAVLGALGTAASIYVNPERGWAGYLIAFFFVVSLALGGMFITVIQHMAKAGWSVTIRRFAEAMTAFVPMILVGSLVLLGGLKYLYSWTDAAYLAATPMVAAKTAYLNIPFLVLRLILISLGFWAFKCVIVGHSLKQDKDGDESHTIKNVGLSIAYLLFFAIGFSLFSVDLLMTLMPTWYSTIFGVYAFAGMAQSGFAFLILLCLYIMRSGFVNGYVTIEHVHDLAKYLKGFTVFWAYIAFSQYMLIWYANIPEETEFYLMRSQNGWTAISLLLLIGKFIVPFLALLPRAAKRTPAHLVMVCVWVLVMQFIDIFWLVAPNFNGNVLTFGLAEVAPILGFGALFLILIGRFLKNNSMVAIKDPRIDEALNHHVTY